MSAARGRKGAGSFTSLGKNKWRYRFTIDGERHSVTCRTQAECYAAADALRRGVTKRQPATPSDSLEAYLGKWLASRKALVRPRTLLAYESSLRLYVYPAIGSIALREVSHRDVERMMAAVVGRGRTTRMANMCRTVLGTALRDAQRDGLIVANPVAIARAYPARQAQVEPLSVREVARLLTVTREARQWPLYVLAVNLGVRQGELLALRWQDIDADAVRVSQTLRFGNRAFFLEPAKTAASERSLPVTTVVRKALAVQRRIQERERAEAGFSWHTGYDGWGLVFRSAQGRPMRGKWLLEQFQADLATLGIAQRRFHDLRHTTASVLLAQGTDIKVIQAILGHSTIAVTANTYAHVGEDTKRGALRGLDRVFGRADKDADKDAMFHVKH